MVRAHANAPLTSQSDGCRSIEESRDTENDQQVPAKIAGANPTELVSLVNTEERIYVRRQLGRIEWRVGQAKSVDRLFVVRYPGISRWRSGTAAHDLHGSAALAPDNGHRQCTCSTPCGCASAVQSFTANSTPSPRARRRRVALAHFDTAPGGNLARRRGEWRRNPRARLCGRSGWDRARRT